MTQEEHLLKERLLAIQPQEELEIRNRADEMFKHRIRGVRNALPVDYTTDDIVNVFRQEGYIEGYKDALRVIAGRLYRKHPETLEFIKEYIKLD